VTVMSTMHCTSRFLLGLGQLTLLDGPIKKLAAVISTNTPG